MGSAPGGSAASGEGPVWRLKEWVLLTGPRTAVAAIAALAVFAFLTAVSVSPVSPFHSLMPVYYAYGGLISGNLTVVTVVVSINQLLLSQQLNTPDELRSQIDGVVEYREDVEESAQRIAPSEPQGFLRVVLEDTRQRAQQLRGLSINEASEDVSEELDEIVTEITRKIDRTDSYLQESDESTFQVLASTLTTNYARQITSLRQLKFREGDQLPSHVTDGIEELTHSLQNIDIARQYFKTIYLQQELAAVSRLLFYVGVPAVAIVAATLFSFTAAQGPGVSRSVAQILVPAVITVGLLPLIVLFSFIIRGATVACRTAAIIPFTAPIQEK